MYEYADNFTERMLSLLAMIDTEGVKKVECIDGDTKSIPPACIHEAPNLCFIDGEHTPAAVLADFDFCLQVCAVGASIVFHDAQIVFRGLRSVVSRLKVTRRRFSSHALSDSLYVINLDGSAKPAKIEKFASQTREDDLWSPKNYLHLLKWRAQSIATKLLRANGA
jgi:hypothetical protein